MFAFAKKDGPTLGLDINSQALSLIQLEKTKTEIKIVRFAAIPTPENAVKEGLLGDPEAVGAAVKELLVAAHLPAKGSRAKVNLAVPGQSVVIRLIPVPVEMPEDELNDVITQEAINSLPFPLEEANLDWSLLPATERVDPDGVTRVDVIMAAIQKIVVESYWRMAAVAGVQLNKLDITSLSVIKALSFAGVMPQDSQLTTLVTIRHDATDITLVRKGMPLFSRSVLLGIETLCEAIARSINISPAEAFIYLPTLSLLGMPAAEPQREQAAQIARSVFGDLTAEIGRSLEFYMSQAGSVQIDQMLLCGPACIVPDLDSFIANRLNCKTVIANPFQHLNQDIVPEEQRVAQAIALGLVVSSDWLSLQTAEINLNQNAPAQTYKVEGIEQEETEDIPTPWFLPALGAGTGICLILVAIWAFLSFSFLPAKEAELTTIDQSISKGKAEVGKLSSQKEEVEKLEKKKQSLSSIVNHGAPFSAMLRTIKDNTPEGVQLTSIDLIGNRCKILGNAIEFAKASHMALNLASSPLAAQAEVKYIKRAKKHPSFIGFEVDATVRTAQIAPYPASPMNKGEDKSTTVASSSKPKVLDFYATWCPPCKKLKPVIEEAERMYAGKVEFVAIDIDDPQNKELVETYNIKAVPNLYFLDSNGNVKEHIQGFPGSEAVFAALEKIAKLPGAK